EGTRWKVDSAGEYVLDEDGERIPVVTVRFQATGGWAGGVFGVRVDRAATYDTTPGLAALAFDTGSLAPAFDPAVTDYTLTVPEGTTSVVLDADPHVPSGLVRVDGVLVDDTQGRVVPLSADGSARTVDGVGAGGCRNRRRHGGGRRHTRGHGVRRRRRRPRLRLDPQSAGGSTRVRRGSAGAASPGLPRRTGALPGGAGGRYRYRDRSPHD